MLRDLIEEKREYIKNAPYYSDMIERVRKAADKYIETPLKCLPWSDFGRYFETGSRKEYERVYFDRRGRLSSLAVMYIIINIVGWGLPNDKRYYVFYQLDPIGSFRFRNRLVRRRIADRSDAFYCRARSQSRIRRALER